jgi:SAM-dependent methyltransferase
MPVSPSYLPLTAQAQAFIAAHLQAGDWAIDATLGNGHDSLFLAQQLGEQGRVLAFDIQTAALTASRLRLQQAGLLQRVQLIQDSHAQLRNHLHLLQGRPLGAAMFNLGYLPGGDKGLTTNPAHCLSALEQCCSLLRPGGAISLLAYTGHPGGREEADALLAWVQDLPQPGWQWQLISPENARAAPILICIGKHWPQG